MAAGNPDVRRQVYFPVLQRERGGKLLLQTVCHTRRIAHRLEIVDQERKRISLHPSERISGPDSAQNSLADFDQEPVGRRNSQPLCTIFKPSRIKCRRAKRWAGWRRLCRNTRSKRSMNKARFGRPVNESWNVSKNNRCSACRFLRPAGLSFQRLRHRMPEPCKTVFQEVVGSAGFHTLHRHILAHAA